MGIVVVNAYIEDNLNYVRLSKEIKILEADALVVSIDKLQKALVKAKEKYPETIGVTVAENMLIRYMAADEKGRLKFEGIIWSTRSKLAGTYEIQ